MRQLLNPIRPFGVLREQLLVDARLVVEALGVAGRHQLDQVVVALVGLREQDQMVLRLARDCRSSCAGSPGRHVDLAAENRLHAPLPRVVVKDHRREQVAVLGDRHRRHLQRGRLIEQLVDPARAVEQRKLGVEMEMDELRHGIQVQ